MENRQRITLFKSIILTRLRKFVVLDGFIKSRRHRMYSSITKITGLVNICVDYKDLCPIVINSSSFTREGMTANACNTYYMYIMTLARFETPSMGMTHAKLIE